MLLERCRSGSVAWKRWLGSVCVIAFPWACLLRDFHLGAVAQELSLGSFHAGGNFRLGESFDYFRVGSFTWVLSPGIFHLGTSAWSPSLKNFVCERSPWTPGLGDWLRQLGRTGRRTLETLGATFVCVVIMSLSKNHSREPRGNIPASMSYFCKKLILYSLFFKN